MEQSPPGWTQRVLRRPRVEEELEDAEAIEAASTEPRATVIEQGCRLEGRMLVDRPVRIEGELHGSITSTDSICVMESGTVEGDIKARSIEIRGAVVGNVTGSREVILHPSGKLHGQVETSSLVVERGAYFNGQTSMHLPQLASRVRDEAPELPETTLTPAPSRPA